MCEWPSEEILLISAIPGTVWISRSMGAVTYRSTCLGEAPGQIAEILTRGSSVLGEYSIGISSAAQIPARTIAVHQEITAIGRFRRPAVLLLSMGVQGAVVRKVEPTAFQIVEFRNRSTNSLKINQSGIAGTFIVLSHLVESGIILAYDGQIKFIPQD